MGLALRAGRTKAVNGTIVTMAAKAAILNIRIGGPF
jgi:hypothetical protein